MELSLSFKMLPTALLAVIASVFAVLIMSAPTAGAQTAAENLCDGANLSLSGSSTCDPDADGGNIDSVIATVVNIFTTIVGVAAVIMIIYGGFKYITSGGDSGNLATAKNTILYAIIGLIIVALAQIIVRFVISKSAE